MISANGDAMESLETKLGELEVSKDPELAAGVVDSADESSSEAGNQRCVSKYLMSNAGAGSIIGEHHWCCAFHHGLLWMCQCGPILSSNQP